MPRSYSRPRRRFRRRSRFRRRRFSRIPRPRVRPDGIMKEKVTIQRGLRANSTTSAYHNIHWLNPDPTPGSLDNFNTGAISNNTQFGAVLLLFQFYQIYGVKIKFVPDTHPPLTTSTSNVEHFKIGSRRSGAITQPASITGAKDFKVFHSQYNFQRYYRIGKYSRG